MRRNIAGLLIAAVAAAVASLPVNAQTRANWPRTVTIGSASIGGVYHIVAGGYVKLVQEKLNMPASNRVTGGPVQNIQLVQAKQIELGLTTMGPAFEGSRGEGWARGVKHDALRFAFPMYTSYAHWVVRGDSPIRSILDLQDKTVDLGPRGGSAEFVAEKVFQLFKIRPRRIVNLSFAEGANALRDGLVDANFGVIGVPVPAWLELSISRSVRFIGFTGEQINQLTEAFPYLSSAAIRANAYRGQTEPIRTVQMWNAGFVHRDQPDDFVYTLTKTLLDSQETLQTIHPTGAETVPIHIFYVNFPLHPGAVRFYQEKRVSLKPIHLGR